MSTTAAAPPAQAQRPPAAAPAQHHAGAAATPPGVNVSAAELRRLTAAVCDLADGDEGERGVVDTALATARAYDRYHPYRVSNRKDWKEDADAAQAAAAPTPSFSRSGSQQAAAGTSAATAAADAVTGQPYHHMRTYGVHLRQGVMLALVPPGDTHGEAGRWTAAAATAAGAGSGEPPVVRLVHIFRFSRPLLPPAARSGREPLPTAAAIEMDDCRRPKEDLRFLAPRLLGTALPPDLAPLMLAGAGSSSSAGSSAWPLAPGDREAAAAASYAFAAWLACLPPPGERGDDGGGSDVGAAEAGGKGKGKAEGAGGGGGGVAGALWRALGGLHTWFGGAEREVVREEGAKHPGQEPAHSTTTAAAPAGPAAATGAAATGTQPLPATPAEAWAEFERRVRAKAPGETATETERQWLRALGLME
ncbi:hypothetical protein HXX76_014787 [Chlamydomonas incerta]|uniref:Uncharacterized protein n=1 Tax=Chlamydomonas incerta TaxID=51695 RepID=A0A835SIK0_CHLIN|nr:hypothetical protein HXX76_014787 [Chlamydomonas incerta]|eukprot:KAG2424113.1 hypothetical protein HXX76_014787 [Chlamydomonas incerta]